MIVKPLIHQAPGRPIYAHDRRQMASGRQPGMAFWFVTQSWHRPGAKLALGLALGLVPGLLPALSNIVEIAGSPGAPPALKNCESLFGSSCNLLPKYNIAFGMCRKDFVSPRYDKVFFFIFGVKKTNYE